MVIKCPNCRVRCKWKFVGGEDSKRLWFWVCPLCDIEWTGEEIVDNIIKIENIKKRFKKFLEN